MISVSTGYLDKMSENPVVSFLNRSKMPLAILVGIGATAALKYKRIHVPEGTENPSAYKTSVVTFSILKFMAKIASNLKGCSEATVFRSMVNYLLSKTVLSPKSKISLRLKYDHVDLECVKVGETPVRIFSKRSSAAEKRPIMMFFHGGAYVIGQDELYESFLRSVVDSLNIVVVGVNYKLAPENPFPAPIDDCHVTTKSLLSNLAAYNLSNIDLDRVILTGESAGANIATVLTIRFKKEPVNFKVKAQVLIYPPTQYFNFLLPSSIRFSSIELAYSRAKFALWHMGISNVDSVLDDLVLGNVHLSLLSQQERDKFRSLVNVECIEEQHKSKNRFEYDNYSVLNDRVYPNFQDEGMNQQNASKLQQLIDKDPSIKDKLLNLFNPSFSPLLADDSDLLGSPSAFFIVAGQDCRKDECLIYAQRLKKLNGNVDIDYYEHATHGCFAMKTSDSQKMEKNIHEYLKNNI